MLKLLNWIKTNKLLALLLVLVAFLLSKQYQYYIPFAQPAYEDFGYKGGFGGDAVTSDLAIMPPIGGYPGSVRTDIDLADRLVVTTSYFSLLVKDVSETIDSIKSRAEELGGFMVNSSISTPDGLTNGDISVRVPADQFDDLQTHLRGLAVKVVSENISGYDVTDQYFDIEERLATLETTKAKYEEILASATNVDDILRVTEALVYVQDQIDYLVGQQEYLAQTSETVLVTVYLSTDELELPYVPEQPWRPELIFKTAVRAVVELVRTMGTVLIWAAVFSVVWIPIILAYKYFAKRFKKK